MDIMMMEAIKFPVTSFFTLVIKRVEETMFDDG